MPPGNKKLKKKGAKPKLSSEELAKRDHIKTVRKVFRSVGFQRIREVAEQEIKFGGQTGLPESSSGLSSGYKVISFYADAATLLARGYVLRREGWRGSSAYQRMLLRSKIENIRRKLKSEGKVFVNNIIATLPSDVHPEGRDGKTVDMSALTETKPVILRLPQRPNSIGIIDGQHRLYSYYETAVDDPKIKTLRHQQNLLVTGLVFPKSASTSEKERFAAGLFLTINSNQTKAKTTLRQDIEVVLNPSSTTAIARQVMDRLAKSSPLSGHVEMYSFEKGKLKTSSIVSFGLAPLIKLQGNDSLFSIFKHPDKEALAAGKSVSALPDYLQFAATRINIFLNAVKANTDELRWTADPKVKKRLLTVTYINSFLITLRHLISTQEKTDYGALKAALADINHFPFQTYKSSQYNRMADEIFKKYFS